MRKSMYLLCVAGLLAASPALRNTAAWNGTWKIDWAKSKTTGDTFTNSMNPTGTIHVSNGSAFTYDFACDGKEYKLPAAGSTTVCTKSSDTTYHFIYKNNGKVESTEDDVLSSDGKTMTDTSEGPRPDGSTFKSVDTFERVSPGTSGLIGTWKHVTANSTNSAGLMTIVISGATITVRTPAYKSAITAKLDRTEARVTGPTVSAGVMVSFKLLNSRQIYSATKFKGKVVNEDTMTLSTDGTTITDVVSSPGQAAKQTYVYQKQ